MWSKYSFLFIVILLACGSDESLPKIGDPNLERIILEVSYEPDAVPYTGETIQGAELWSLFSQNFETLFQGTGLEIVSPIQLAEMGAIEELSETDFTSERILELDQVYRETKTDQSTLVFHAIWLDGYFFDGVRKDSVIGVSIGDSGAIAIFKPVVESLALTESGRRFGEQMTLIHEVGHALGLVNGGLNMQKPHQDESHGAHCDEQECVMFWANEGPSDLVKFVQQFIASGKTILFDANCISDVRGAFRENQ